MKPILTVNRLRTAITLGTASFTVVNQVSFQLYPGKLLALVGESGCGKTLTALSIMRILPPQAFIAEGEIFYHDQDLLTLSEKEMRKIRGARIAMIFQDPNSSLNPVYTIGDQLLEVVDVHLHLDEEEAEKRVVAMLEEVGIPSPLHCMSVYPHQLSGGMKQRVMIAMALMCEPDILIADEPTTALDVTIQSQILLLIKRLQEKRKMAVLLITHDIDVVAEVADEMMVMYASEVMEKGTVSQVFQKKAHSYTQGLFNSKPELDSRRGKLKAIPGTVPPPNAFPSGCKFHPRCPFVMDKCKQGIVPDFVIEEAPLHISKCWLYE